MRHGQVATQGVLTGSTDIELSPQGWQQLQRASNALPPVDFCISSPLKRCYAFAQDFCQKNNTPLSIEVRLQEMDFGDWDGKSYQTLWAQAEEVSPSKKSTLGQFWQNPWENPCPNGELITDFTTRVDNWWQQWLEHNRTGNTLVVTHAGVIKHLVARVLGMPIPGTHHLSNIDVPYGKVLKIEVFHDDQGKHWPKLLF